MIAIAYRVVLWLLPRLIDQAVDLVVWGLEQVAAVDGIPGNDVRRGMVRESIDEKTGGYLPDVLVSVIVEVLVIIYRLGITPDKLNQVDVFLQDYDLDDLLLEAQRNKLVTMLSSTFPDLPGRAVGMLYDFAVLRLKGG